MTGKHIPFMAGLALGAGLFGLAWVKRVRRTQVEGLAWQKLRSEALDIFACPECRGTLTVVALQAEGGYFCPTCQKVSILARRATGLSWKYCAIKRALVR